MYTFLKALPTPSFHGTTPQRCFESQATRLSPSCGPQLLFIFHLLSLNSSLSQRTSYHKNKQETKPMSPSILILLFFLSIAGASVEEACKNIATARPNIGYEFCLSSLASDPSSINSDLNGLAIIAANLSIANATQIMSKTGLLMEKESNPSLKDCLNVCSEVYSDAIDHLNAAIKNLSAKCYKDAMTFLSAALDASDDCEEAFDEEGDPSPMAEEDKDYGRLADIALTIAASLG